MFWKQSGAEFGKMSSEPNRLAFKSIVESGTIPGILVYQENDPAGWCAIEPRDSYARLARARVLAPVDTQPVWSITCFYIGRQYRQKGLMRGLVNAAIDWAESNGAHIVESYPFDTKERMSTSAAYMGVTPVFLEAGFAEVLRKSPRCPIMRKYLYYAISSMQKLRRIAE